MRSLTVFHSEAGMLADLTVRHDHTFIGDAFFLNISRSNQSDTDGGFHVRILPLCKLACATRFMHAV